jgi:hypothetical protein
MELYAHVPSARTVILWLNAVLPSGVEKRNYCNFRKLKKKKRITTSSSFSIPTHPEFSKTELKKKENKNTKMKNEKKNKANSATA